MGAEPADGAGTRRWLTIEAACRLLGVDQSTLRRWSDAGRINVFVTPGGHRRYAEADVRALILRSTQDRSTQDRSARGGAGAGRRPLSGPALADLSLARYGPERLSWVQEQPWYRAFDRAALGELREEGRQLVELAMRYLAARGGRAAILGEARGLAERYGARNAALGVSLTDGVAAFLFFRGPTVETVAGYLEGENLPPKRAARVWHDLGEFLDAALLAMIGAHERALVLRPTQDRSAQGVAGRAARPAGAGAKSARR